MFGQGCGQFQMCLLLQRLSFQVLFYSLIIMLLYITVNYDEVCGKTNL